MSTVFPHDKPGAGGGGASRRPGAAMAADRAWVRGLAWVATVVGVAVVVAVVVQAGLDVRAWAWEHFEPARFQGDIGNAFRQGRAAEAAGSLGARYQEVYDSVGDRKHYGLDYPPGRLLIARTWYRWLQVQEPGITRWRNDRSLTWPLLRLNLAAEATAVVGLLVLVWQWVGRSSPSAAARRGPPVRRIVLSLLAATAMWLNPVLVLNAHAWPQWDAWLLPFVVWAMVAATAERFVLAGLLLAAGAMLKGQILLGAPVLLAWPLLQGRLGSAGRLALGLVGGFTLAGLAWLAPQTPDRMLIGGAVVIALSATGLVVRWPAWDGRWVIVALLAVVASATGGAVWRDESWAWLAVGFGGGYQRLAAGPVANLPALLGQFGWRYDDLVDLGPWLGPWQLRTVLLTIYGLGVLLCGFAAARHARRGDRRVLVALVLPWALMFALLMQMHERYLLYAAALSACWLAVGVGPALLHVGLTAIAWICTFASLARQPRGPDVGEWQETARTMATFIPGVGWALLVMVAVGLYLTLAPRGGTRQSLAHEPAV